MSTVFVHKEEADALRLQNTTGVAILINQFLVMTGKCLQACEAVAIAAVGGFKNLLGTIVEAADFVAGESTFATSNLAIYWNPIDGKFSHLLTVGYYRVGYTVAPIASGVVRFVGIDPVLMSAAIGDLEAIVANNSELAGRPFMATATLTSATAATPVVVLAAAEVTGTQKAYIHGVFMSVDGGTAWGTTATVAIQDSAAAPVVGCTAAVAGLTANAMLMIPSTSITLAAPIADGVGFTAAKGINVAGNANGTGSNLLVTIFGYIK